MAKPGGAAVIKTNTVQRIRFTSTDEEKLKLFLDAELRQSYEDHGKLVNAWKDQEKSYDALPDVAKKNFPFANASNLVAPLVAIHTEAIFARVVNTIFSMDPLWVARPTTKEFLDAAKPTEQFLHWTQKYRVRLYERISPGIKQVVKLGTGVLCCYHEKRVKKILHYDADGKITGPSPVTLYNGPVVDFIRPQDFLVPSDGGEFIEDLRWCAHRRFPTWWELKRREVANEYRDVDKIKNFMEKNPEGVEEFRKAQFGVSATMPEVGRYETFVWWGEYDANGDGQAEECRFVYHKNSRTILDATYNYLLDGRKPYIPLRYMSREGSFHGEGIAWQLGSLARSYSTQINQAIDNVTVSNCKVIKAKKGSVRQDEELWPGKIWILNRLDDIEVFDLGAVNQAVLAALGFIKELSQLRSGVSDYGLGSESAVGGSRATATSTLALIQEGNKRFDLAIRDVRGAMSEVGMHLLLLEQQYGADSIGYMNPVTGEEAQYSVPTAYARLGLGLDISASSASINREVEKQNSLALFNLVSAYYEKLTTVAAIMAKPEIPGQVKEFVATLVGKSGKLLERVLQAYSVPDPETFQVDMETLAASGRGVTNGGPQGGIPGAPGGGIPGAGGPMGELFAPPNVGVPGGGPGLQGPPGGGIPGVP